MRPCTLHWNELHIGQSIIPASHLQQGERVRIVINFPDQYSFMRQMFSSDSTPSSTNIWLEDHKGRKHLAASPLFSSHIGSLIQEHGLLANLSLRENLLLAFLYHAKGKRQQQALKQVEDVAKTLGLYHILEEKAGDRTAYIHALVSLGRCLLMRPTIIVAQEVHAGMPPEHLEKFKAISLRALNQLGSGLLYLTGSPTEGSGLNFSRTLHSYNPNTGENSSRHDLKSTSPHDKKGA